MRKLTLLFIVALFIPYSCDKSRHKDRSLTVEGYRKLGMPDPSRIWTHEDYSRANTILFHLKSDKPFSLPRKGSTKSGKYFDRLINPDNFSFLNDDSVSLSRKAFLIQSYTLIKSDLIDIYTNIYSRDQYYSRELIYLYLFGLTIAQKMLDLSYKINKSDEKGIKGMQSGFRTVQYNYLATLIFILDNQKNVSSYRVEDLEILTDSLFNSVEKNKGWMEVSTRGNLKDHIQTVIDSVSTKYIRKKYHNLIEIL